MHAYTYIYINISDGSNKRHRLRYNYKLTTATAHCCTSHNRNPVWHENRTPPIMKTKKCQNNT